MGLSINIMNLMLSMLTKMKNDTFIVEWAAGLDCRSVSQFKFLCLSVPPTWPAATCASV